MNEFTDTRFWERFHYTHPFSLSQNSTIGSGGVARVAFFPSTVSDTVELLDALKKRNVPFYTVGCMSNVLPPDGASKRVFVCTKRLTEITEDFFAVGVTSGKLLAYCKAHLLSGVEFLEGIPCTLGGALYMNAGVQGGYIGDVVERVKIWREGETIELTKSECNYAYKHSAFMDGNDVILGAKLHLQKSDLQTIQREIARYQERRKHLPKGKSMGCVFKNPQGVSAGALIEGTGLKGYAIGGARISTTHANFIINEGNASSAQICALIALIKNAVFAQYKIRLEEEIRYLE